MRKKHEESLIRCAFGDLSPEEEAILREDLERDPQAGAELRAYDRLRVDLRSLGEVPPDQLSVERMRDAILARGLERTPIERSRPWFWMPATAMAVAFGIMMVRPMLIPTQPDVVLASGSEKAPTVALNVPGETVNDAEAPLEFSRVVWTDLDESPRVAEGARRENRTFRRSTREEPIVAMNDPAPAGAEYLKASVEAVSPETTDTTTNSMPVETPPAEPLVVIEPVSTMNGTMIATEVESFGNVLVGG